MKARFIPAPDHPLINRKQSVRSVASAAREADALRDAKAIARHKATKKYAKEMGAFISKACAIADAPRKGIAVEVARPLLTKEQVRAKRRDWVNA